MATPATAPVPRPLLGLGVDVDVLVGALEAEGAVWEDPAELVGVGVVTEFDVLSPDDLALDCADVGAEVLMGFISNPKPSVFSEKTSKLEYVTAAPGLRTCPSAIRTPDPSVAFMTWMNVVVSPPNGMATSVDAKTSGG